MTDYSYYRRPLLAPGADLKFMLDWFKDLQAAGWQRFGSYFYYMRTRSLDPWWSDEPSQFVYRTGRESPDVVDYTVSHKETGRLTDDKVYVSQPIGTIYMATVPDGVELDITSRPLLESLSDWRTIFNDFYAGLEQKFYDSGPGQDSPVQLDPDPERPFRIILADRLELASDVNWERVDRRLEILNAINSQDPNEPLLVQKDLYYGMTRKGLLAHPSTHGEYWSYRTFKRDVALLEKYCLDLVVWPVWFKYRKG